MMKCRKGFLKINRIGMLAIVTVSFLFYSQATLAQISVVNIIPNNMSDETNQDSEPNLAVKPTNPDHIAASAFARGQGFCQQDLAPIFVSADGGSNWVINCIVPSDDMTGDITVRFSESENLYAGILRRPGWLRLNILRTTDFQGASTMTVLEDRSSVDQPYVQATTVAGRDRVYVGNNDFAAAGGRTATIDESFDAQLLTPTFTSARIESRATVGQDGPPIRPAIHADGTVYAIFYGWRNRVGAMRETDVVVVRDDNGGTGAMPFTDLLDPIDNQPGIRVLPKPTTVPWANFSQADFGQERFVGSNISIATDPRNSSIVYIAWADQVSNANYTLHVRRSLDRGQTWSKDLRVIDRATNPALAINANGTVGFLYQQVKGKDKKMRWVTHIELTDDGFHTVDDNILANVPATSPAPQFIPYIGDYVHLMAVGFDFHGIFSANNTPDATNFPNGVLYQRNANFSTKTLLGTDTNRKVDVSIDPFYFKVEQASKYKYEYAAKIVCGLQRSDKNLMLTKGMYATSINIHNPNNKKETIFKKLALTYPPGSQKPGKVIPIGIDSLKSDQALGTSCHDIRKRIFHNGFPKTYIEGFVIVQSNKSMDVTAVYTAASVDRQGRVLENSNIEVEQISERKKLAHVKLPDLVPVPDKNGFFCKLKDNKLIVTVKNQGSGEAGESKTEVDFFRLGKLTKITPALAPNTETNLTFKLPVGCFDPDCGFKITVDINKEVDESNEGNNVATGNCIG